MAEIYVDLSLGTGDDDGSTWLNAYQGKVGLDTAMTAAAHAAGDTIWVQHDASDSTAIVAIAVATLASATNPVRIIGCVAGTTNEPPTSADIMAGNRNGSATRAYAGTTPPTIDISGSASDWSVSGCVYAYGLIVTTNDDIIFGGSSVLNRQTWEECSFEVSGSGDAIRFFKPDDTNVPCELFFKKCKFTTTNAGGLFQFRGAPRVWFEDCKLDLGNTGGAMESSNFSGCAIFDSCDFSGSQTPIVDVADFQGGEVEFQNCQFPATHVLKTGTATGAYKITNNGSDNQTTLTTGNSEQIFEIETLIGRVDVSESIFRTGGATDGADGAFSYAVLADNVTDNFVGMEVPLAGKYVSGDGTTKTYTVFIANSTASTDFQDDEVYLKLTYPSEAGNSMYDYKPDEDAPTGLGLTDLSATPADLTDDTGSAWESGANNHQKLTASIDPAYGGVVRGFLYYSRAGGDILYVDPRPTVA